MLILGSLDGIETGVRQLVRDTPLKTTVLHAYGQTLTVLTEAEILRIKGVLILKRNAARDYLDFMALANHLGDAAVALARRWYEWTAVQAVCAHIAVVIFDQLSELNTTPVSLDTKA